jgi:hypothetical protein
MTTETVGVVRGSTEVRAYEELVVIPSPEGAAD